MGRKIWIGQRDSQKTLIRRDTRVKPKVLKPDNMESNGCFRHLYQNNSLQN